ncbi:MAG: PQQ-binding-like beta-propeller repeat protein [Planctomycetota bacterium]
MKRFMTCGFHSKPGGLEEFRARGTGRPPAVSVGNVDPGGNAMRRKPRTKITDVTGISRSTMDTWRLPVSGERDWPAAFAAVRSGCSTRLRSCVQSTLILAISSLAFLQTGVCWSQPGTFEGRIEIATSGDIVLRERRWQTLLTEVPKLLESDHVDDAVRSLQKCFAAADDGYVLRPEWEQPAVRGIAAKLLRDAGEPVWKRYEELIGAEAKRALERLEIDGPPGAYQGLVRRYEHTLAGATALDRLANWNLGRGDYDSAVNCWEQLLSNPVHTSRFTTIQRLKLFFAANRSGRTEIARREAEHLDKIRIELAGQSLPASDWRLKLEQLPRLASQVAADWRFLGGVPERTRVSQGSAPFLLRPSVSISMFDAADRKALTSDDQTALLDGRSQYDKDLESALSVGSVMGFAGTPIVNDNLILWRDSFGVRAIDRRTRETAWAYSTATRLHSLLVFNADSDMRTRSGQSTYRYNSVLEQLTSDRQHVYLVDPNFVPDRGQQFLFNQGDPNQRDDGKAPITPWNAIVALRITGPSAGKAIAWKIGGHPTEEPNAVLAGHFFLGPPLPVGGLLYSVAEYQKQIWLIAAHPDTGRIEWRQTLSLTPQFSRESMPPPDKSRLAPACLLAGGQGVLVCPLASGLLVAVNQITGEILWAHDYRVRRKVPGFQFGQLMNSSVELFNDADFPNPPLIHQDRVYFLTPGEDNSSDHIVCLDLHTGKKVWQVSTPVDLKYLASADRDVVVGVGATEICGLSAQTGTTTWQRRTPRISGVGAVLPGVYLLPIADGRVLSLDLRDGREIGFAMQSPEIRPGNLVVSGRDVISLNGLDLQVFPQSADLLASLEAKPAEQRSSYQFWYELGELQFRMGQLAPAKQSLAKAMSLAEPATQSTIRGLLRELAWHELLQQPEQRPKVLAEYAELCELPEHRAQHLLLQAEDEVRRGDLAAAQKTSAELLRVDVSEPLRLLSDPDRHLTASVWISELAKRSADMMPSVKELGPTDATIDELLRRRDRRELRQFLEQYPQGTRSAEVRLTLAQLLSLDGQSQAAELLVWQDHLGTDPAGLAACRFLLELWDVADLYEESGLMLHQIGTRLGSVTGSDGLSGRDIYINFPKDSLVWQAAQRFVPPDWKIDTVQIREEHSVNFPLRNTFNTVPRLLHFPNSSQQLIIRGQTPVNMLQQVDCETGAVVANINLPSGGVQGFFPYFDARNRIGHYLPLGGVSNCYGISLLERSLGWHRTSSPQVRLNNMVRVGPSTPQISIFRTRDRLLGLDPANGQLLWERSDLEETGRSIPNALTSVPGDAEVVVLLESESKNYRVFKTSDGSFVRQGKLTNCYYIHQQFGRNLLYSTGQNMRNIQLWDPLTDKVLFEASDMASIVGVSDREPEFTVADTFGKVRVVEGLTGRVKIEINLNPNTFQPPPLLMLKSFTDGTRYYVNVHRQGPEMNALSSPTDAIFPTQQIAGDLHAIDPATSKVLWSRTKVPPQNVVHLSSYRLPFLVTLSRWRGQSRANTQPTLRIDVIDGETGTILASKKNVFYDRLLLSDYDRTAGQIRFRGAVTQVHLGFGPKENPADPSGDEFVKH